MPGKKFEVVSYSGYRGEETPRAFFLGSGRVEVIEVLERWEEQGGADRKVMRCFKVRGDDGLAYTLCYDEQEKEWSYNLT